MLKKALGIVLLLCGIAASQATPDAGRVLIEGKDGSGVRRTILVDTSKRLVIAGPTGTSSITVQGTAATGAAPVGNPVSSAFLDTSGNVRPPTVSTNGALAILGGSGQVDGVGNSNATGYLQRSDGAFISGLFVSTYNFDGNSWNRTRSASLANLATSQTSTARNSIGVALAEKGSRWGSFHNPAAGSQATISWASEASVRHVADCVSFSAGSTTAPALTALTINLRDGASGAGTVIQSWQVVIPAATGQNVAPFSVCGLGIVGTTATAMTLEFSAGLANLVESVSLTGYNVN